MSTQHFRTRIPLPCRYYHTAEGCPYGKSCKYDHYSNHPSYFNYIKQKLHQISKPQNATKNDKNIINIMIEAMQQCVTQIISQQFNTLHQEINALKSTINQQNKLLKNTANKQISDSLFTKQFNKITKLLKQNNTKKTQLTPINNTELNQICNQLQQQFKQLKSDKKTFQKQIKSTTITSDLSHTQTITKLPPPRNHTRTKRKTTRSTLPFDNIKKYDNIFEATATQPAVTMDQIVALPIPPKTKPKPVIKKITKIKNKSIETNVIAITSDNIQITETVNKVNKPNKKNSNTKQKKNINTIRSTKKKKLKRNKCHRKKHIQFKSKHKKNVKYNNNKQNMKCNDNESMDILPVLNSININEMDWYQIVKSDSSDDDNMTSEDVQKLDMLDSI